ncbi:MAG: hypothetical protein DRP47_10230 [Candidatus Zixiibacteriota bacterium]|nr:MAG: hypothetical protein DRP47_10230 [candidate division Zixibacteria bacterium]
MSRNSLFVTEGRVKKAYSRALVQASRKEVTKKIMSRQAEIFSKSTALKKLIGNRLGWVDIVSRMKRQVPRIEQFGQQVFKDRLCHVVLMGMGGSSLCPELFKLAFRKHPRLKTFDVIDSTDPVTVKALVRKIDPRKTLFIVSSKSGSTIETRSHMVFFIDYLERAGVKQIGKHFVAITDKGSALEKMGKQYRFRKIFLNPADIGGRYSALSYFGLVPGFFAGVDLQKLLESAGIMEKAIRERTGEINPALVLGTLMATAAKNGVDKLTFVASKKAAPLVPWIEQLIGESTGKKGKGIIPIEAEQSGTLASYGQDRLFVSLRLSSERSDPNRSLFDKLIKRGYPVVRIEMESLHEIGAQFLLWEAATAVAGYHLHINPFDEPNVSESKANTAAILKAYQESGQFDNMAPTAQFKHLALVGHSGRRYTRNEMNDLKKVLKKFFSGLKQPEYLSLLGYFKEDNATEKEFAQVRSLIQSKKKVATLRGYGPRFLHSIGQLYKGGPPNGRFVVFVKQKYEHLDIPGQFFDFGQLISAQAIGDARALAERNLPMLVVAIDGSPSRGLKEFNSLVQSVLK